MSVIATVAAPAEEVTLGAALADGSGVEITLERVVPLGSTFVPYFWIGNASVDRIERALRAEADVESFEIVDRLEGETLVRIELDGRVDGLLDAMAATDATVLQGVGSADGWRFQLRFDDHDPLTEFYRRCSDEGIALDLRSVHNPGVPAEQGLGLGITDTQRETLRTALEAGYFDVPRGVNLTELAAEMGVSDTAVSQRIRRGITALLEATLSDGDTEDVSE